ncbi:MAG: hypothetical protein HY204_08375 [Nitrospirae bacterium]|nr:hypothetical protein [Nitrospirota bacterium]
MKKIIFSPVVVLMVVAGSWAMAQTGGGGMVGEEGRRYGMMAGYLWWWSLYGIIKAAVVVIGLWLLYRITKAVERIAASKP